MDDFNYNEIKKALNLKDAGIWLREDSKDDFFPDAITFSDIDKNLDAYLEQRKHRIFQIDTFPSLIDHVPKKNGMVRESVWLHPNHRILYLAVLHYFLPKLDHHLLPEVYSYRLDTSNANDYPFPNRIDRWKSFHNDFRQACLDDLTQAVLITDIASFYDHIKIDELIARIISMLGGSITKRDKDVAEFLKALLNQWSVSGYGIPQNVDASSFFGSFYLSGADQEIIDKRYNYFRWVDDIRICARNKKQALRSLHDLQHALGHYRLFLASDKTKIIMKGTEEFDQLLDVDDDEFISRLEDAIAKSYKSDIEALLPETYERLIKHSKHTGNDRKFRALANRLLSISEFGEFREEVVDKVSPLVIERLEAHPERSDYWSKMLAVDQSCRWKEKLKELIISNPSVYNWQRFYLWKLLTAASEVDREFIDKAKSIINNPISDLEAYQAIIFIGKHGHNQDREMLFTQYFSPQRSYPFQRAILIAIQELAPELRIGFYDRAVKINQEHSQLVSYLSDLSTPNYGVRKRPNRKLLEEPRVVKTAFMTGIGKAKGKMVRYRLSRSEYDYE